MPDLSTIKRLLRETLIFLPLRNDRSQEFAKTFNQLCGYLFGENLLPTIWDERILLQLQKIFAVQPLYKAFSEQVKLLIERAETVRKINDFCFSIINREATAADVCATLSALGCEVANLQPRIEASDKLQEIRSTDSSTSVKIQAFLDYLTEDLAIDFKSSADAVSNVLEAVKAQEKEGGVNALLINKVSDIGITAKFLAEVQNGNGQVNSSVPVSDQFQKAVERARLALCEKELLRRTDDVNYSLEITEADYSGESIALPAAAAIYATAHKSHIDVYTGLTGDINYSGQGYVIKGVHGIEKKLDSAVLNGCRRVFIPKENENEIADQYRKGLRIHFAESLIDVLLILQRSTEPLPGDTLQIRKINLLKAECIRLGIQLSEGVSISHGQQFTVSSLSSPEMKINIYDTGKHTASPSASDFQHILDEFSKLDNPQIPIQSINKTLTVKDARVKSAIRKELEVLKPSEIREEQNCDYSYSFEDGQERIVVKQFAKGTLQFQGRGGMLYIKLLETVIKIYNLHNPNAVLKLDQILGLQERNQTQTASPGQEAISIALPYLGTDESGKGDYFGPMVIAAVWVDDSIEKQLLKLGIKDSKLLSDRQCQKMAQEIRKVCAGKFEEVEILPERYNDLYNNFVKEGKNLNHLLAWGHARAIESLLSKVNCSHAVADQFGDEKYIKSKLMEKGKVLQLIQTPKAERFTAVAAASILARDKFLSRINKLSTDSGIALPKGASDAVVQAGKKILGMKGEDALNKMAKLHHKTTLKIKTN